MLKHTLATSALATLLATAVYAQTSPATDPAIDPAAPVIEGVENDAATMPADEGVTTPPEIVEDDVAPGAMDVETAAPDADMMDPAAPADWAPMDVTTMSTENLIGADIVNYEDETIASIEEVIVTADGQVESLVARFGGFLGFGADRVLLTIDEVEVMQDADEELIVRTNLTPESIETRPAYEG